MTDIYLYIYDISNGIAKTLSASILGYHLDGVWHTSVVMYDTEYFFSQEGILDCHHSASPFGKPLERKRIGHIDMSKTELRLYLDKLSRGEFKEGAYDLFHHNCNSFTARVVKDLTGSSIPDYITNLTSDFLSTPIGAHLRTLMEGASHVVGSGVHKIIDEGETSSVSFVSQTDLRPVIFDEPLGIEFFNSQLNNLFSSQQNGLSAQWASETLSVLQKLCNDDLDPEVCSPETFELLRFSRFSTFHQCEAICEIFRLAIWKFPEFFMSLSTAKTQNLDQFADHYPPKKEPISRSEYHNLDSSKARLFCNFIALSSEYRTEFIPSEPLIKLCTRLISFDPSNKDFSFKTEEHEQIGIALSLNVALCPLLTEPNALELAACLFHLIEKKRHFKVPLTASFALRALYAFVKRSDDLFALALSLGMGSCIRELISEAENNVDSENPSGSVCDSVDLDKKLAKELISILT